MNTHICRRFSTGFTFFVHFCAAVLSSAHAGVNLSTTVCTSENSEDSRLVRVIYEEDSSPLPCRVMYQKSGTERELASAKHTLGFCEKTERQVVKRLASSGWDCRHALTAAGIEPDYSVQPDLNLEGDHADPELKTPAMSTALVFSEKTRLQALFEQTLKPSLQRQLLDDLQQAAGEELSIDVKLNADISVGIADAVDNTQHVEAIGPFSDRQISLSRYVLATRPLNSEQFAHNLAAEIKRVYPNLEHRVAEFGSGLDLTYRVVYGAAESLDELNAALDLLGPAVRELLLVLDTDVDADPVRYVPTDWQRYAIAHCLADGYTSVADLARCSSLKLTVGSLLACLGGSICIPAQGSEPKNAEDYPSVDLLAALDSDEPVAKARDEINISVDRCKSLKSAHRMKQAECIAMSLLDESQEFVFECFKKSDSVVAMLACSAGSTVADVVSRYEQCTASTKVNLQCLIEMTGSDFVGRSVRCLDEDSDEAIARCTILANVDTDRQKTLACLGKFSDVAMRARCIAGRHIDPPEAALLNCSLGSPSSEEFGLCTVAELEIGSALQWIAAECLYDGVELAIGLLNCAGGRFAGLELLQCLHDDVDFSLCFHRNTLITEIVNKRIDRAINPGHFDRQIASYRKQLYSSQGGDLSAVLAAPLPDQWLETADRDDQSGTVESNAPTKTNVPADGIRRFGIDK
jgi:hypothetical protein